MIATKMNFNDIKEIEIRFIDKKKVIIESNNAKGKIIQKQNFKDVDADFMPLRVHAIKEFPMQFSFYGIVESIIIPYTTKEKILYKFQQLIGKLKFWRGWRR